MGFNVCGLRNYRDFQNENAACWVLSFSDTCLLNPPIVDTAILLYVFMRSFLLYFWTIPNFSGSLVQTCQLFSQLSRDDAQGLLIFFFLPK